MVYGHGQPLGVLPDAGAAAFAGGGGDLDEVKRIVQRALLQSYRGESEATPAAIEKRRIPAGPLSPVRRLDAPTQPVGYPSVC